MSLVYIIRISHGKGQPWKYTVLSKVSLDFCRKHLLKGLPHDENAKGEIYKITDEKMSFYRRVHTNESPASQFEAMIKWGATKCDSAVWVPERKMYRFGTGKYGTD